jgi:hypothetical protein
VPGFGTSYGGVCWVMIIPWNGSLRSDAATEPLAAWPRQMVVRLASVLGIAALATMAVAAGGCGSVTSQPNGTWTGCGNMSRPSVMQVQRTVQLARSTPAVLLATERRARVVRRL